MEKLTIKQIVANRQNEIRKRIIGLIGFKDGELNQLMFDMGVEYMERRCVSKKDSEAFLREPMFWAWWKQQWSLIDESFWYNYSHQDLDQAIQIDRYQNLHHNVDYFPDKVIWEKIHESYRKTSQRIIDKMIRD